MHWAPGINDSFRGPVPARLNVEAFQAGGRSD